MAAPSLRRVRPLAAGLAALLATGCTLTEVVTEAGADLVVVESVLRPDTPFPRLLLHRALTGATIRGEPGARVVVRTETGREVVFQEAGAELCLTEVGAIGSLVNQATCYVAEQELRVEPGRTYWLDVRTTRGERLRSRTVVPGAFSFRGLPADSAGITRCSLPVLTPLTLTWTPSAGTWSYLANLQVRGLREALAGSGIRDIPDPLELTGLSITERDTSIVVPANFGVFERARFESELLQLLQLGFPVAVDASIVVAAVDRNYVNAVRGGRFNPSGSVRVSSIVGDGVGLFGSLVPLRVEITVVDPARPPASPVPGSCIR
jgi:hypothetical protein